MPQGVTQQGDLSVIGNIAASGQITGNIPRSSLILESGSGLHINPGAWRIWDAYATLLTSAPAGDDLGIVSGTFATQIPYIRTPDLNASGGPNNYRARYLFDMPYTYEIGQNLILRLRAGMITAVAATSATIDVEAHPVSTDTGGVSADICTTAAQSINFLAFSDYDFTLAGATIGSPNQLDIRVTITTTSATASSHFGAFSRALMLIPTRG